MNKAQKEKVINEAMKTLAETLYSVGIDKVSVVGTQTSEEMKTGLEKALVKTVERIAEEAEEDEQEYECDCERSEESKEKFNELKARMKNPRYMTVDQYYAEHPKLKKHDKFETGCVVASLVMDISMRCIEENMKQMEAVFAEPVLDTVADALTRSEKLD